MTECNDAIYLTFQHRIQVPQLHMKPSPHHVSVKVWYLDSIDNLNNDLVYLCSRGPLQPLQCTGSHYHYSRLPMVRWCHSPVTTANCCPVPSVHTNNAVISFLKFAAPTNTHSCSDWILGCAMSGRLLSSLGRNLATSPHGYLLVQSYLYLVEFGCWSLILSKVSTIRTLTLNIGLTFKIFNSI